MKFVLKDFTVKYKYHLLGVGIAIVVIWIGLNIRTHFYISDAKVGTEIIEQSSD